MYSNNRQELFPTIARTSPVIFSLLTIINCIVYPSYNSFYIFIMYFATIFSNTIFKNLIFKPLYKVFNISNNNFLGLGNRPKGANGCAFTLDNKISTSFGMPSGHSQIAWTVAIYILCRIINNLINNKYSNTNNSIKILNYLWFITSCILILWIAFYISYSRVYIEGCHTIQQVIVGGVIGGIGGIIIYYNEYNIKLFVKSIVKSFAKLFKKLL